MHFYVRIHMHLVVRPWKEHRVLNFGLSWKNVVRGSGHEGGMKVLHNRHWLVEAVADGVEWGEWVGEEPAIES